MLMLILILSVGFLSTADASIRLPAVLSDHMVIQQQTEVTLWGWTNQSSDQITVRMSWSDEEVVTDAQAGHWEVQIRTPEARTGCWISLTDKFGSVTRIEDVLIGEVWLGSGQSNMEMNMDSTSPGMPGVINFRQEIAEADFPEIRLFKVERQTAWTPQHDLIGQWVICSPEVVKKYSAVGYYFSRRLHQELTVPVGFVLSAWGGTAADAWTPAEAIQETPVVAEAAIDVQTNRSSPRAPGILYNAMIHPLLNLRISGILWYQGESNRWRPETYQPLMTVLIRSWRQQFGEELPFYFVQIAPYDYSLRGDNPGYLIREAQLQTLEVEHTAMVVTSDVGDFDNIHPRQKKEVGERLAAIALSQVYHLEVSPCFSPVYREMHRDEQELIISFDQVEEGLIINGETIQGAFVAGADKVFYPAAAKIVGDQLLLFSDQVREPVAARYGFCDRCETNLTSGSGIPVSPFRTDSWAESEVSVILDSH